MMIQEVRWNYFLISMERLKTSFLRKLNNQNIDVHVDSTQKSFDKHEQSSLGIHKWMAIQKNHVSWLFK